MKKTSKHSFIGLAAVTSFLCLASFAVRAQFQGVPVNPVANPGGAQPIARPANAGVSSGEIRITNLIDIRKEYLQSLQQLGNRSGGKQKKWGVFEATFDTAKEWTDEMSVTFFVMLLNDKPAVGEKPMSLYTATFEYDDVKMGRDHKVGVVLPPGPTERYGKPIGFAVQISIGGRPAGESGSAEGTLRQTEKWWTKPEVLNHQNVQKRTGLIERTKSVFALVDTDSYEIAK